LKLVSRNAQPLNVGPTSTLFILSWRFLSFDDCGQRTLRERTHAADGKLHVKFLDTSILEKNKVLDNLLRLRADCPTISLEKRFSSE
jgi:hypothetical protein